MPLPNQPISKLFDVCSVTVAGQHKRGARMHCGHCDETGVTAVNTLKNGTGDDDEVLERMVLARFEKLGWKIGKDASRHRCPKCFTHIKLAAVRKSQMQKPTPTLVKPLTNGPVIPEVTDTAPRSMTRDERRIIFEKINEVYVGEKVGYSDAWDDDKVSKDLGVPRAWVSSIREDMFGPDVNETTLKQLEEVRAIADEVRALLVRVELMEASLRNPKR